MSEWAKTTEEQARGRKIRGKRQNGSRRRTKEEEKRPCEKELQRRMQKTAIPPQTEEALERTGETNSITGQRVKKK